jgi:hypothetical protein
MPNKLAYRLKDLIFQLESNPNDALFYDIRIPSKLLSEAKKYLVEITNGVENGKDILKKEISSEFLGILINQILARLYSLDITWTKNAPLIVDSIKYSLNYLVRNYPCHIAWYPVRIGIEYPNEKVQEIDNLIGLTSFTYLTPIYELRYGVSNSLFTWNGCSWRITPLGDFFKSLSVSTGTLFLLMVEEYFSVPYERGPFAVNPWHIPDPNLEFLKRLGDFGLTYTIDRTNERRILPEDSEVPILYIADDYFEVSLTKFGRDVISKCLSQKSSSLPMIVSNLISFELNGSEYLDFADLDAGQKLIDFAKEVQVLTGDQLKAITSIVEDLGKGTSPIAILRSIPPTIEAILKNALFANGSIKRNDISKITLNKVYNLLEDLIKIGNPLIQEDTILCIKSVDRNSLLHANVTPSGDLAKAYVNLMLNILVKIYQDYSNWEILYKS